MFLLTGMNAPEVRAEIELSRKGEALAQTISRGWFSRALINSGQLRWRILLLVVLLGAIALPLRTAFKQVAGEAEARATIQDVVKDLLPPGELRPQQVAFLRDSVAGPADFNSSRFGRQYSEGRAGYRKTMWAEDCPSVASIASQSELAELMQRFSTPSQPTPAAPESLEDIRHEVITRIQPVLSGIWPIEAPLQGFGLQLRAIRPAWC